MNFILYDEVYCTFGGRSNLCGPWNGSLVFVLLPNTIDLGISDNRSPPKLYTVGLSPLKSSLCSWTDFDTLHPGECWEYGYDFSSNIWKAEGDLPLRTALSIFFRFLNLTLFYSIFSLIFLFFFFFSWLDTVFLIN